MVRNRWPKGSVFMFASVLNVLRRANSSTPHQDRGKGARYCLVASCPVGGVRRKEGSITHEQLGEGTVVGRDDIGRDDLVRGRPRKK